MTHSGRTAIKRKAAKNTAALSRIQRSLEALVLLVCCCPFLDLEGTL